MEEDKNKVSWKNVESVAGLFLLVLFCIKNFKKPGVAGDVARLLVYGFILVIVCGFFFGLYQTAETLMEYGTVNEHRIQVIQQKKLILKHGDNAPWVSNEHVLSEAVHELKDEGYDMSGWLAQ